MAPPAPFLLPPPGDLPGPVPAVPNSAERLVAGSGLHTGTGRLRGPMGGELHIGEWTPPRLVR